MSIDNSRAKGLTKQVGRDQKSQMDAHLNRIREQAHAARGVNSGKGRKRWFKNTCSYLIDFSGQSFLGITTRGSGKNLMGSVAFIDWPLFERNQTDARVFQHIIDARHFDIHLDSIPISFSGHGIQRLIQSVESSDIEIITKAVRTHVLALIENECGMYLIGHEILIYQDNGVSIWTVTESDNDELPFYTILKTFIRSDRLDGTHEENFQAYLARKELDGSYYYLVDYPSNNNHKQYAHSPYSQKELATI